MASEDTIMAAGAGLVAANLWVDGQFTQLWDTAWNGTPAKTTRGSWRTILFEAVFVLALSFTAEISDEAGQIGGLLLAAAWLLFLLTRGPDLAARFNAFTNPPPAKTTTTKAAGSVPNQTTPPQSYTPPANTAPATSYTV